MTIAKIIFNLFSIFIGVYSIITIFALLRYGKARATALIVVLLYAGLIVAFYLHGLDLIRSLAS